MTDYTRVQFGCGLCAPQSWTNFDSSATVRAQRIPLIGRFIRPTGVLFPRNIRIGDVVRGLPVPTGACTLIYSSHVLEHLTYPEVRVALRNVHSYLRPGGIFRFVLPDLEAMITAYLADQPDDRCERFVASLRMVGFARKTGIRGALHSILANSSHRSHWDFDGMRSCLSQAGFRDVRRARFGDSADAAFVDVEDPGRWEGALGIEARK